MHICHIGGISTIMFWNRLNKDNHYKLVFKFDPAAASLIGYIASTKSRPSQTRHYSTRLKSF